MNWKKTALVKQLAFKRNVLKLSESGKHGKKVYEHILSDIDAEKGENFYCFDNSKEWSELKEWAGDKIKFSNNGLKNMLRSEHIAYNIFYPLEKLRKSHPEKLNTLIGKIIGCSIDEVLKINIEFAGGVHKRELLNDNTSFDVYIECKANEKIIGIGIEVKYTEKSYPWGKTERERMVSKDSEYNHFSKDSVCYIKDFNEKLATTKLKQFWRNHLLGIKMKEKGLIDTFYSLHLYPENNTYQKNAADEYLKCLNISSQNSFIPLTFENFISFCEEESISGYWVQYLKERY